ncbi:hypothetical protein DRP44_05365 [candidate division TA06 bacterium]|uniref:DUF5673 domain-containing protein n=1 Tax=candidate division TA06 bacterium TaxID=2250710 RepID=A0A660S9E4_UNCT6|nr:MAG: hypothetical protein DRP44_05365 [candidate division TA06 bacterium]
MKYKWTSHPVIENQVRTILLMLFLILIFVGVYFLYGFWWFLISFVFILSSLSSYFMKTEYTISENGVEVRSFLSHLKKDWQYYRSFYEDKNGIFLSPFLKHSRLENFRGLYLRFGLGDRDKIRTIIKEYVKTDLRESKEKQK